MQLPSDLDGWVYKKLVGCSLTHIHCLTDQKRSRKNCGVGKQIMQGEGEIPVQISHESESRCIVKG